MIVDKISRIISSKLLHNLTIQISNETKVSDNYSYQVHWLKGNLFRELRCALEIKSGVINNLNL